MKRSVRAFADYRLREKIGARTAKHPAFCHIALLQHGEIQQFLQGKFAIKASIIFAIKALVVLNEFSIEKKRPAMLRQLGIMNKKIEQSLAPHIPLFGAERCGINIVGCLQDGASGIAGGLCQQHRVLPLVVQWT